MSNAEQEIVRPYPEYKPSGSQWIGEIPSHWRSTAIKRVSQTGSGGTPPTGQQEYYGEGIPWVTSSELREQTITSTTETISERAISEIASLKLHSKGSVVIAMYGATIGRLGILGTPATVNQACCACKASQHINSNFLYHWLLANKDNLSALGQGGGQPNLSQEIIREFPIVLPPLEEQTAIVRYLDNADQRIRAYVSVKERLIALLGEQRQALVHQAVTRGLDPSVRLKPSGVEWLGEVPKHWEIRRLKSLVSIQTGGQDTINRKDDGKYPFFVRSQTVEKIDTWSYNGEAVLTAGDGAGVGKVFHYINGKFDFHQRVYKFSEFAGILGKLFFHSFKINLHQVVLQGTAKSTVDSLRLPMLQNFPIPLPPMEEQAAIVDFCEKNSADIEISIALAHRQIELMEEYRTRLIADVVTGQLDVREAAEELPTPEPTEITD